MILECVFIMGLCTGLSAGLILYLILSHEERKAQREFKERQEKYREMI